MKRTLIILTLAALLVLPLIITGSCGGGPTLTDSDIATIRGFGARLDSHDSSIATINNTLSNLGTDTLGKLADLDADELAALLALDLDTALSDITQFKADMDDIKDPDKGGSLADLAARVEELENNQPGGSGVTPPITTGQVTAVFSPTTPVIVSGSGLPVQQFNVVITNGTTTWQYVSYSLIFTCKTAPPPSGAEAADLVSMQLSTILYSLEFTFSTVQNGAGYITQITAYPVHGVAAAPGSSSSSILNYLNFNLPLLGVVPQEWNCTIIPVSSPSSW